MRLAGFVLVVAACHYQAPDGMVDPDAAPDVAPAIDAPPGAWLDPWTHRKAITIHGTQVQAPAGGLIEFPVLIALDDPDIAAGALANGRDLAVTGDDAMTRLAVDLETYQAGKLALWVKVPVLDNAADTRLYLYYGNAAPPDPAPTDVWTRSYVAVWHLSQNPNAGNAGDIADATANGHDGQAEASFNNTGLVDGKAGKAIDFDGVNQFIGVPSAINLGAQFTISAWVFLNGGSGIKTIWSNSLSGLDQDGCRLFVDSDASSDRMLLFETSNGNGPSHKTSTSDVNRVVAQQWKHVAVIADRAAGTAKMFVDGVDRTVGNTIRTDFANNTGVELGRMGDLFTWPGVLDQIEIASELRPPQWVTTSFTNQNDPAAFYQVGSEQSPP